MRNPLPIPRIEVYEFVDEPANKPESRRFGVKVFEADGTCLVAESSVSRKAMFLVAANWAFRRFDCSIPVYDLTSGRPSEFDEFAEIE